MRRLLLALTMLCASAGILAAAPISYAFDYDDSRVGFTYVFDGQEFTGRFPEFSGNLVIDFQRVANSSVSVVINTTSAQGGFPFATDALRGPRVLAVRKFPEMRFTSHSARAQDNGAIVSGDLTVRDVTRPVELDVRIFRDPGSDPEERDNLILRATTRINRSDFNAGGYSEYVGDALDIDIRARIRRVK